MLGLVFPMCECGIVPVMRRLLRKGLPLGTCVAYMLAGPIINLVVIISTAVAFGPHGIGHGDGRAARRARVRRRGHHRVDRPGRSTASTGNAFLTPSRPRSRHGGADAGGHRGHAEVHPSVNRAGESRPLFQRIANISETALHDFIDIMVFLTLGACLAGAGQVWGLDAGRWSSRCRTGTRP